VNDARQEHAAANSQERNNLAGDNVRMWTKDQITSEGMCGWCHRSPLSVTGTALLNEQCPCSDSFILGMLLRNN
jgi:hypothetical protein